MRHWRGRLKSRGPPRSRNNAAPLAWQLHSPLAVVYNSRRRPLIVDTQQLHLKDQVGARWYFIAKPIIFVSFGGRNV